MVRAKLTTLFCAVTLLACDAVRVDQDAGESEAAPEAVVGSHGRVIVASTASLDGAQLESAVRDTAHVSGAPLDVVASLAARGELWTCGDLFGSTDCANASVDAMIGDSRGGFGAVADLRGAPSPLLAARVVAEAELGVVAGEGALELLGVGPWAEAPTARSGARATAVPLAGVGGQAVLAQLDGAYVVALTSAGVPRGPRGRLTAIPVAGAAGYAGRAGAVGILADSRWLMRRQLARLVHDQLASGMPAKEAALWAQKQAGDRRIVVVVMDADDAVVIGSQPHVSFTTTVLSSTSNDHDS